MNKKIIAVIMAALVMVAAMIPISATDEVNFTLQFAKTTTNPGGIATGTGTGLTYSTGDIVYLRLYGEIQKNKTYSISILTTCNDIDKTDLLLQNPFYGTTAILTKEPFSSPGLPPVESIIIPNYNFSSYSISSIGEHYVLFYVTFNTNEIAFDEGNNYIYLGFKSDSTALSVTLLSNTVHAVSDDTQEIFESINNSITNINSSVQEVINNQENNSTNIEQIVSNTSTIITVTETISSQVSNVISNIQSTNQKLDSVNSNITQTNDYLYQIQYYGSDYDTPQGGKDLDTAQKKLSESEKALSDKSTTLKEKVESQWSDNKTITNNFVSTITPATAAITNVITDITAVMPDELQALLVAIPMLLFIGWLIGRID